MKAKIKEPGLFGKTILLIDGNEIKEAKAFGKTLYIIKGNEVKEAKSFGKTLYIIDGNDIKEPKTFGKTLYKVDGRFIKEPGMFGKTLYILDIDKKINSDLATNQTKDSNNKSTTSKKDDVEFKQWLKNSTEEERIAYRDKTLAEMNQTLKVIEKKMKKRK